MKLPPLPEPAAWNCYWKGDNDGPSWDQWHDASDPMPEVWEGTPPNEVVPHFTADQMRAYVAAAVAAAIAEEREAVAAWLDSYDGPGQRRAEWVRARSAPRTQEG